MQKVCFGPRVWKEYSRNSQRKMSQEDPQKQINIGFVEKILKNIDKRRTNKNFYAKRGYTK